MRLVAHFHFDFTVLHVQFNIQCFKYKTSMSPQMALQCQRKYQISRKDKRFKFKSPCIEILAKSLL